LDAWYDGLTLQENTYARAAHSIRHLKSTVRKRILIVDPEHLADTERRKQCKWKNALEAGRERARVALDACS